MHRHTPTTTITTVTTASLFHESKLEIYVSAVLENKLNWNLFLTLKILSVCEWLGK